jgi:hypothetical protein
MITLGDIFEAVKDIGSVVALVTACFLVRDRYVKHFPLAIIVARPVMPGSRNIVPSLYVKNVSDRPILILWSNEDATQLRIGRDQSEHGLISAMLEDETIVALGPASETYLPLIRPGNYDEIDADNVLQIGLRWRFAQPRIWKADRKIRVWVLKRNLDFMVNHYVPPADAAAAE